MLQVPNTLIFTWLRYGKPDVSMTYNAALAGLVGITAGCDAVSPLGAAIMGIVFGIVIVLAVEFFDKVAKIDDPVGADYVLGYASYETVDFVVDSALTDGQSFVSDTRDLDRMFNSLSFNIGWRPLRNIGIEAFYQASLNETKVKYVESYTHYPEFARGEYKASYKVYGLDLLGYIPINDYIEFIASVGVGKYDAEAKVKVTAYEDTSYNQLRTTSKTFEDSKMAYRIGAGGQIWLSKHLTFRVMARWTQIGGDFMKYITEVNAGVRYHF